MVGARLELCQRQSVHSVDAKFRVDFSLADTLAGDLACSASEKRLEAGCFTSLDTTGQRACFIPADKLSAASAQVLGVEPGMRRGNPA